MASLLADVKTARVMSISDAHVVNEKIRDAENALQALERASKEAAEAALKGMAAGSALLAEIKAASIAIDIDSSFKGNDEIVRLSSLLEAALNNSGFSPTDSESRSAAPLSPTESSELLIEESEGGYFVLVAQNCISQAEESVVEAANVLSRKKANASSMVKFLCSFFFYVE